MDLVERLQDSLNTIEDLPAQVAIGYLQPADALALYALPGSSTVDKDWAGNETRRINYEIAVRTKKQALANTCMWQISNYLDQLDNVISANQSFVFEKVEQTGLPSVSEQDDQGYTVYMLDFYCVVVVNNRKKEL